MAIRHKPGWWSWQDIILRSNQLGIPNFQRGAVWGAANRTALLESLYEESPCGSFVLWAPRDSGDATRHGKPLRSFGEPPDPIWLVDGQQRSRAMLTVFEQLLDVPVRDDGWSPVRQDDLDSLRDACPEFRAASTEADDDDEDEHVARFWGVVLSAMRAFDQDDTAYFGESEARSVLRGSMFRRPQFRGESVDGRQSGDPALPAGIIPFATLLAPTGVFNHRTLRSEAKAALRALWADDVDLAMLDELIPWGPQFITGYTFRHRAGAVCERPLKWVDVVAARSKKTEAMVERLEGLFADRWQEPVFRRFHDMYVGKRFAFGWLPSDDVSVAIDAYVRINRSGIRVRAEEQALALLSRARPSLLDDLHNYLGLLPGDRELREDSREMLTHESDRQMGFAVWMRVVTRYTALAMLGRTALTWLETSAIDKKSFGYDLNRMGGGGKDPGSNVWARSGYQTADALVAECSQRATRALLLVDSVLSKELHLDHRMARPSTRALMPMLDLLYRLPVEAFDELEALGEADGFRAVVARSLRWTLVAPYLNQAETEFLIRTIHGFDVTDATPEGLRIAPWSAEGPAWRHELREALGRYRAALRAIWENKDTAAAQRRGVEPPDLTHTPDVEALNELALHAFEAEVRESRSLQNPMVGWLYAIEHRGQAREFDWSAQFEGFDAKDGRIGVKRRPDNAEFRAELLRAPDRLDTMGLYPEKQHIVPFTDAKGLAHQEGGTRATASPANAIGNLTWLSSRQNGFKALSDQWAVMDRDRDFENLIARGMLAAADGGRTALDLYEELQAAKITGSLASKSDVFTAFCRARTDWMVAQMAEWLNEPLAAGEAEWLGE